LPAGYLAIAERANGIIKEECVYRQRQFGSISHARGGHRALHQNLQRQPTAHEHRVQDSFRGPYGARRTGKKVEEQNLSQE